MFNYYVDYFRRVCALLALVYCLFLSQQVHAYKIFFKAFGLRELTILGP